MSGQRLRLTTSRPAGYRRGGQVIGNAAAPTFVERNDVTPEQALAIFRDPNIAIAIEAEGGKFQTFSAEERAEVEAGLFIALNSDLQPYQEPAPVIQPDTAEPQGEGLLPGAEASQAGGPDATAADSTASAGGAAITEPTAQPIPPAPEPAAKPAPASRGGGKKRGTTAA